MPAKPIIVEVFTFPFEEAYDRQYVFSPEVVLNESNGWTNGCLGPEFFTEIGCKLLYFIDEYVPGHYTMLAASAIDIGTPKGPEFAWEAFTANLCLFLQTELGRPVKVKVGQGLRRVARSQRQWADRRMFLEQRATVTA